MSFRLTSKLVAMSERNMRAMMSRWSYVVVILPVLLGCSLIFPPRFERQDLLVPNTSDGQYTVKEDGSVAYETDGLRVEVKYMTDRELNELFPKESSQGQYSTNPYTYGDYVDPAVGYVRKRFTVFQVTVYNSSYAKVELQPLRTLLTTDREGEVLEPYGILAGSAANNFESYYRARRGPSGNENYRFNMRMGIVRTNNYRSGERIFKGESYGGFIVFDPLDREVEAATLHLRDFVLKFNAYDTPLETVDIPFSFTRQVTMEKYEEETWAAEEEEYTRVRVAGSTEVRGNVTGDVTRDVTAIDAYVKTQLSGVNQCFEREYMAGKASEGEVTVRFDVLSHGEVESAEVVESSVVSEQIGECIVQRVMNWRFKPSGSRGFETTAGEGREAIADTAAAAGAGAQQTATSARVTATVTFEFSELETE